MKIVEANITSFIGQCGEAEHYYCHYKINEDKRDLKYCSVHYLDEELKKPLTDENRIKLSKKDNGRCWGDTTTRFDSIEEVHNKLIELFPNENIITYDEARPFRNMLCIIDGKNLGFEYIGEIWNPLPSSLYKDLIVGDYKIKCHKCGHEFTLDEVIIYERKEQGREWVKFIKRDSDLDNPCCERPNLEWNLIY